MRSSRLLPALAVCLALIRPTTASSGVPNAATSIVPQCLTACPAGDMPFTILVHDATGAPVPGANVELNFSACPDFTLCTIKPTDPYAWDPPTRTLRAFTDALGAVTFPIRGGNVCGTANGVTVFADGVILAGRTMASPDQNGDLMVDGTDDAIANGKVGSSDPTADFDCDGSVTLADVGVLQAHFPHACVEPTKATDRSWGGVKIIYR